LARISNISFTLPRKAEEKLKEPHLSQERKAELEKIGDVMGHIAHNPPRDFHDAVQLIILYHIVIQLQVGCCSFGHVDNYLLHFIIIL